MKNYYFFCYVKRTGAGGPAMLRYSYAAINDHAAIKACMLFLQDNATRFHAIDICYINNKKMNILQHIAA